MDEVAESVEQSGSQTEAQVGDQDVEESGERQGEIIGSITPEEVRNPEAEEAFKIVEEICEQDEKRAEERYGGLFGRVSEWLHRAGKREKAETLEEIGKYEKTPGWRRVAGKAVQAMGGFGLTAAASFTGMGSIPIVGPAAWVVGAREGIDGTMGLVEKLGWGRGRDREEIRAQEELSQKIENLKEFVKAGDGNPRDAERLRQFEAIKEAISQAEDEVRKVHEQNMKSERRWALGRVISSTVVGVGSSIFGGMSFLKDKISFLGDRIGSGSSIAYLLSRFFPGLFGRKVRETEEAEAREPEVREEEAESVRDEQKEESRVIGEIDRGKWLGPYDVKDLKNPKELSRAASMMTISRLEKYADLNASTVAESDGKFIELTKQLWKEVATHIKGKKGSDTDGNCAVGLLTLAGVVGAADLSKVKYIEQGGFEKNHLNVDVGEGHVIEIEKGWKTARFDHHGKKTKNDLSATKITYETLVAMNMLEKSQVLDRLVDFVTKTDNMTFPNHEEHYPNSWRTVYGLHRQMDFDQLHDFFKRGGDPIAPLSEEQIQRYHLGEKSTNRKNQIEKAKALVKELEEKGMVFNSQKFGKVLVDYGRKLPHGTDAAYAFGYDVFVSWDKNQFFMSSKVPFTKGMFPPEAKIMRGNMCFKERRDKTPVKMTLSEVVAKIGGKDVAISEGLKKAIEDDNRQKGGRREHRIEPARGRERRRAA